MNAGQGRSGSLKLIACPAVLGELAEGAVEGVDCHELEAQLHVSPQRLKEALRVAVADADVPGATIVLGYGLCSNSVLGLKTEHATLVVPKVDDCIAMLLGSNEAFAAETEKQRGSYFVARAYLEACDTLMSDHEKLAAKRGRERAEKMMRLLLDANKPTSAPTAPRIAPTPARANGMAIVVPTASEVPMANVLILAELTARGRQGSIVQIVGSDEIHSLPSFSPGAS